MAEYLRWFETLGMHDVDLVGGKNASLGEMISHLLPLGVQVPGGFATTAQAYRDFLAHAQLADRINAELDALDVEDVAALARSGEKIRGWILEQPFPDGLEQAIVEAYGSLCGGTMRCQWRCVRPPRPKTCRTPPSPASRKPF